MCIHVVLLPTTVISLSSVLLAGPGPLHEIAASGFSRSPLGRADTFSFQSLPPAPRIPLSGREGGEETGGMRPSPPRLCHLLDLYGGGGEEREGMGMVGRGYDHTMHGRNPQDHSPSHPHNARRNWFGRGGSGR